MTLVARIIGLMREPLPTSSLPASSLAGVFALNNQTGLISTAKALDYEANSSHVLKVQADSMRVVSSNLRAASKST